MLVVDLVLCQHKKVPYSLSKLYTGEYSLHKDGIDIYEMKEITAMLAFTSLNVMFAFVSELLYSIVCV